MKLRPESTRTLGTWVFAGLVSCLLLVSQAAAQGLDDTWTVTVNGQTVRVNPDGSFRVPNIAVPDQFGPGGPGSAPDFLSDDFLRVTGISIAGEVTRYAFSEPFQIRQGQTYRVGDLTITTTPPPFPESLRMETPTNLLELGDQLQITTIGTIEDGSEIDVTPRSSWTIYRTSNPSVATIGKDGLVSAHAVGTVFITAVNEGATATKRLVVTKAIKSTTVEGFVQLEDGTAVNGATVTTTLGPGTTTDSRGFFSFLVDLPSEGTFRVNATATVGGKTLRGSSGDLTPVEGGLTDAGLITLKQGLVPGNIKLLIVHADTAPPLNEMRNSGFFSEVAGAPSTGGTPTLELMQQYDVILNYTNFIPSNAVLLGDRLADFVDGGGRLVIATYSFSSPWSVRGRITTQGYTPLVNVGLNQSIGSRIMAQISDPIFDGIDLSAVRFFQNSNFACPALDSGATLLAVDNANPPNNIIARNAAGNVYGVNLFPAGGNFGGNNAEFYRLIAKIATFP